MLQFKKIDGNYTLDVSTFNEDKKTKYNNLTDKFSTYDFSNLAFGGSSTANLLYSLGIHPSGSVSTASLDENLKSNLVNIENYNKENGDVLNIGSSMSPSIEAIIELEPDVFIFPDTLISMMDKYSYIEDAGVPLLPLNQSLYTDVYVVLQAILDTTNEFDESIYDEFEKLNNTISNAKKVTENYTENEKTVAIIKVSNSTGSISLLDESTPVGNIAKDLGLINVIANNSSNNSHNSGEFSPETLIQLDPDYIIFFGHSDADQSMLDEFEAELKSSNSSYRILNAVQSNNLVRLGNENYKSYSSVDLRTTDVIKQISEDVYDK